MSGSTAAGPTAAGPTASAIAPIDVVGLRKVYRGDDKRDVIAVDGLDLRVERGEVFGLLGPNGAGKTTTVEVCEGLLDPTAGHVRILGLDWQRDRQRIKERIGVTLQQTQLLDRQTVWELVDLFATLYPEPRDPDEVLGMVGLEEKRDARYRNLSGGQQQRLAVACALAGRPDLLFLDEPTTGLDPQSRRQLWEVVRTFQAGGGTVLLTTHYMEEAALLCDRVMIIDHGRQIALGSPDQLIASLGAGHVVEVEVRGLVDKLDDAKIAALPSVVEHEWREHRLSMTVRQPHVVVPAVLRLVDGLGLELDGLATRHTSLEDVFMHLTGRHLRDGAAEAQA